VSPKQSGQICLLATFLGRSGDIFFPKLDFDLDQIYFKDIALDFLKANGLEPFVCHAEQEAKAFDWKAHPGAYPIYFFTSDTSGEKTYEEFYTEDEIYNLQTYEALGYIQTQPAQIQFEQILSDFNDVFQNPSSSKADIIKVICKYVPSFSHIETGKHLDQKM
jgi:FlaA1/EpsC-like NDP-sugar epimerase